MNREELEEIYSVIKSELDEAKISIGIIETELRRFEKLLDKPEEN